MDAAPWNPGPPYAFYYANNVHVYGVPKGADTSVVLATGYDPVSFDSDHVYYDDGSSVVSLSVSPRGQPLPLVSVSTSAIATDGSALYFAESAAQTVIGKVPLDGRLSTDAHSFQKLAEDSAGTGGGIALDDQYVYWTARTLTDGVVMRVPIAGGTVETLARDQVAPGGIAVDSSGVYWIDEGHQQADCTPNDGSLNYLPPGSTSPEILASNLQGPGSIAVKDGTVYFATFAYCNNPNVGNGTVSKLSNPSGSVEVLASNIKGPDHLFVDSTDVYFTILTDPDNDILAPAMVQR